MRTFIRMILPLVFLAGVSQVSADEITEKIEEASEQYGDSSFAEAADTLSYVVQLINQRACQQLGEHLPEIPENWEMSEPEYQNATASLFDGGNAVSAVYSNGSETIEVLITEKSPALESMLMMVNNPAFLGASGKKIEKYSGQKAILEWNEEGGRGSINVMVAGSVLVSIEGNHTTLEGLKAFAKAIEYKKLVALRMQ